MLKWILVFYNAMLVMIFEQILSYYQRFAISGKEANYQKLPKKKFPTIIYTIMVSSLY